MKKKKAKGLGGENSKKLLRKLKAVQNKCLVFPKLDMFFHLYPDAYKYQMGDMLVQEHGVIGCFS